MLDKDKRINRLASTTLLPSLCWFLIGGIESKTTELNSNQISINNQNLENCIKNVRKINSHSTTKDVNPSLLPQNKKTLDILEKYGNKFMVITLWHFHGETNFVTEV